MRKIFGVAGAIALSIISNPVLSEDMPPIPSEDPRNEEERRRELEGDHGFVDTEVSQVLVQGTSDRFDRSLCKLTNGAFVLCELTAEVGLPAMDISLLRIREHGCEGGFQCFTPFDATDVVGLVKARKGFGAIIKQGENFTLQRFRSWNSAKTYIAMSKTDDITKKICDFETVENQDFNGDQLIGVAIEGDQLIGVKIKVLKTIFPGNDKFDRGLYEIKASKASGCEIEETNGLVISEMGLQPGDTILENDATKILDKHGELYPSSGVIGVLPIKNGIALLFYEYDELRLMGFRQPKAASSLFKFGKSRRAKKSFCYYEEKMDYDFNGNLIIGCN